MYLSLFGLSLVAIVTAAPIDQRPLATCGHFEYTGSVIQDAVQTACDLLQDGSSVGSSAYPHQYNNYEHFYFGGVPGPYSEFPLLRSGRVYAGGMDTWAPRFRGRVQDVLC